MTGTCRLKNLLIGDVTGVARQARWSFCTLAAVGGLLAAFSRHAAAENWTQFRGDNACGLTQSSASLPAEFSHEQNVRWSAQLGEGIASPVVMAGRVFATSMSGPQTFKIFCLEAAT